MAEAGTQGGADTGAAGGAGAGNQGAGQQTDTGAAAGGAGGATQTTETAWMNGLEPDMQAAITQRGYKGLGDLAKGFMELDGAVGRKGVLVPGKDAVPADWDKFYNDLGRPESPDKYDFSKFEVPENIRASWNAEGQGRMVETLHKLGGSNQLVNGVLQAYAQWQSEEMAAFEKHQQDITKAYDAELKREWGQQDAAKRELGYKALSQLAGDKADDLRQLRLLDGSAAADHPLIARVMAEAGAFLGETGLLHDVPVPGGYASTPAEARVEKNRVMAEKETGAILKDKKHPEHKALKDKLDNLNAIIRQGEE